ncbi:hypothetical protein MIPYR_30250 [uncultured Microbacterium sp.]|uniref:Uncharacterized protein n=1 Tax=uncultured Microbacterium sp. TaxID=191216 RepID=A0A1Y5P2D2_9MICO|nr:hypothetical protein MIPYR_30250 [uncultured Microbacterium sp.]
MLRVEGPERGTEPPEGVFRWRVTVHRDGYPTVFHREPEWDERDKWRSSHWFSGVGARLHGVAAWPGATSVSR